MSFIIAISKIRETIRLHINIPKTLYFNFKVFGLRQAIRFPVFLYDKVQLEGLHKGCVELLTNNRMGGVKFGGGWYTEPYGYSQRHKSFLRIEGKLVLGNDITINQGAVFSISRNAVVRIGDRVRFSERALLHSKESITIEDDCLIGWNTQIVDSDFHYIVNDGILKYRNAPVYLGRNVWLANGVSIMKGTCLPAYSVVASNSLVNKDFSRSGERCLFGGIPAKCLKQNVERLICKDAEVDRLFAGVSSDLVYKDVEEELKKEQYQI